MPSCSLTLASVLVLATASLGQTRGGEDPMAAMTTISTVLSRGHVSGSLAYWGQCGVHKPYPDFPKLRALSDYSGSPIEVLRRMFADDKHMRVTQERDGTVRMIEDDVPTDLLDVKIRHISFASGPMSHGANMALIQVLMLPEVEAFKKAHNIGPPEENAFIFPGDAGDPGTPTVSGDLENVTLSQALDYVLGTFPGFWLYENCRSEGGGRTVYFNFF